MEVTWREHPVFRATDLEDSFVLGWGYDPGQRLFRVALELHVTPAHPRYVAPPPAIYACYRESEIVFAGVLEGPDLPPPEQVRAIVDPDGSIDFGTIDELTFTDDGAVRLAGEFGETVFRCAAVQLHVGPVAPAV